MECNGAYIPNKYPIGLEFGIKNHGQIVSTFPNLKILEIII